MEVQRLASSRPVTILNREPSAMGSVASLAAAAAALGVFSYGYMLGKGLSFSHLMYVTKKIMANAVAGLTKILEDVTAAQADAKRHLTQRIENLDGKLDEQKEMSKLITNKVSIVHDDISQIGVDLDALQGLVNNLGGKNDTLEDMLSFQGGKIDTLEDMLSFQGGKIDTLEDKQDYANSGICCLLSFASKQYGGKVPESLQGGLEVCPP